MPENPKLKSGVKVIYLGTGIVRFKSKVTGLIYHASEDKRFLNCINKI